MISHEASGKACGHRGGLIRAIAPLSSLALTPAGRRRLPPRIWSPSQRHVTFSKDAARPPLVIGDHLSGRYRFQEGESVSCTTRFL